MMNKVTWDYVPLEDLIDVHDGQRKPVTAKDRIQGQTPYCGANGVVDYVDGYTHDGEYLLLAEDGGRYGPGERSAYVMTGKFWANNHAHVLSPKSDRINLYYLLHYINFSDLTSFLKGATRPKLNQGDMRNIPVLLPCPDNFFLSLDIQNKLVNRLDSIFNVLSEARRLHDKIVADSNRLMDAVLAEVFPNPENALEKGWILRTVEELSTDPQYGYTASANKQSDGVKFLRITDIQNGIVDWSKVPSCDCNKRDVDQYGLRDGDIVFARTGATTGKTFLVRQPPEAIFASYLIRLQITKLASPDFVYWYFQSPYYWQQINPRGGAQPNMNAQLLKKVRIPVPESFALQDQIVERILSVKSEIDGMQEQSKETGALLANLESSILAQAFRGEL